MDSQEELQRLEALRQFNSRSHTVIPDGEQRYRRYLRALVWYLETSQGFLELIRQAKTQAELERRSVSLLDRLSEEEMAIAHKVGAHGPPEFLESFYKGVENLERFRIADKLEARLVAEDWFSRSVKRLDYIVFELKARDSGEGPNAASCCPAPLSPDPGLSGKDARRYPPEVE